MLAATARLAGRAARADQAAGRPAGACARVGMCRASTWIQSRVSREGRCVAGKERESRAGQRKNGASVGEGGGSGGSGAHPAAAVGIFFTPIRRESNVTRASLSLPVPRSPQSTRTRRAHTYSQSTPCGRAPPHEARARAPPLPAPFPRPSTSSPASTFPPVLAPRGRAHAAHLLCRPPPAPDEPPDDPRRGTGGEAACAAPPGRGRGGGSQHAGRGGAPVEASYRRVL